MAPDDGDLGLLKSDPADIADPQTTDNTQKAVNTVADVLSFDDSDYDDEPPLQLRTTRAKQKTSEPAPESGGSAFDDSLLTLAKESGFTDEEAKSFGSPDNLRKALNAYDRQIKTLGKQLAQSPVSLPASGQAENAAPATLDEPEKLFDLSGLDKEEYGEELLKKLDDAGGRVSKALQDRDQEISKLQKMLQDQQTRVTTAEFDNAIRKLPETFQSVFGEGDTFSMAPESDFYANRDQLSKEALDMHIGLAAAGRNAPIESVVRRAAFSLFGDKVKDVAVKEVERKVSKRAAQHVSEPTDRGAASTSPDPTQRAVSNVGNLMREWGIDTY